MIPNKYEDRIMVLLKYIIIAFVFVISEICYAAPTEEGKAAGENAAEYAVGSSAVTGVAVITAVTGLLLLSMGGGNDGSNTSTSTTTTTTPAN
ncbi:exopolysaccharide production protein YjbE [Kosakonia sp. LAM2021]|uniref:exopolysaccharide production protein YjbE n=1 Tax=Kosakonia sp. LAM2021 TaxID=2800475 RepID=UPI001EEF2861|nr:exopolysaccharide production protein YjbE [Kosakonia sp. LAM2021]